MEGENVLFHILESLFLIRIRINTTPQYSMLFTSNVTRVTTSTARPAAGTSAARSMGTIGSTRSAASSVEGFQQKIYVVTTIRLFCTNYHLMLHKKSTLVYSTYRLCKHCFLLKTNAYHWSLLEICTKFFLQNHHLTIHAIGADTKRLILIYTISISQVSVCFVFCNTITK